MNGKRLLLDTNAVIALLQNNQKLIHYTQLAEWLGISIISLIEFVSFPALAAEDRELFDQFRARVQVIGLDANNASVIDLIAQIRRNDHLKLPDTIIAAIALHHDAVLVTLDKQFAAIKKLSTLPF